MSPSTTPVRSLVPAVVIAIAILAASSTEAFAQGVPQTINFPNPGPTPVNIGGGLGVSATSGLPVALESQTPSVCSVSNASGAWGVTHHIGGTCTVIARQSGNEIYAPAPDVIQSWTVTRIVQTIVWGPLPPRYPNQDVALTAYASPGLRPVTYTSETPAVCPLTHPAQVRVERKGTCTVTAREPGDEVYAPAADVTQSFQVLAIPQIISFTNPGSQRLGSGPVSLAVFTRIGDTQTPGLAVTLTSTTPSVCTTSSRNAVLLAVGTCTIVASQAGNEDYDPAADVPQSFAVALGTPDAPIGVVAQVNGNFVSLGWSAAPTGATPDAYLVEVGDAPGRTTVTSVLTKQLGDTGLLPQGEYFMRVRAQNAAGLSEPSNDVWVRVTGTEPVALPPVAPRVSIEESTVQFTWTPAATGVPAESYLVQVSADPLGGELARFSVAAGTNLLTIPNAPPGTYALRVRAITDAGPSPPSHAIWLRVGPASPCTVAPKSPLMLTPVVSGPFLALAWLPPADASAESFVVQAGTASGQSDLAAIDLGAVSGVGATVGDGHYFVRAVSVNDCGTSAPTREQTMTIGGPTPGAPTGLTAASDASGVTFTWTPAATGPTATHYVVETGVAAGTSLIKFPVGATPTLTIPGVPSGVTFVARVRAANASGIGAASAEIVVNVP